MQGRLNPPHAEAQSGIAKWLEQALHGAVFGQAWAEAVISACAGDVKGTLAGRMTGHILTLNVGSPPIKFSLFELARGGEAVNCTSF
jgi:hypothetical protein